MLEDQFLIFAVGHLNQDRVRSHGLHHRVHDKMITTAANPHRPTPSGELSEVLVIYAAGCCHDFDQ